MAADPRKVGRLVSVRGLLLNGRQGLRPARITVVGAGTTVTAQVGRGSETYAALARWERGVTATGWVRT